MSAEFAAKLRARPGVVRLAPVDSARIWIIRVQVAEAWDAIRVEASPETRVGQVKRAALDILMADGDDVEAYEVKHRGVIVSEDDSLNNAGVKDGSALLVISRRRRPVR